MKPKISTLINYCSNDFKFLGPCIRSVSAFSHEIIVSHCDHFFNGDPENADLIQRSIRNNPLARFVQFSFDQSLYPTVSSWHNRGRAEAFQGLKDKTVEWLLILDADEVADPLFESFVSHLSDVPYDSMRILSYWYFREIHWQALQFEDSALLLRNTGHLTFETFEQSSHERLGLLLGRSAQQVRLQDGDRPMPLFHHYSWARSKEELLRKVAGWGHMQERDWVSIIEKEFQREFNETCRDPVHGYSYRRVNPLAVFDS